MCTSLYRAFLVDQKDPSIMSKSKFNTGLFDFCDMFAPPSAPADAPRVYPRLLALLTAIFLPMLGIEKVKTNTQRSEEMNRTPVGPQLCTPHLRG